METNQLHPAMRSLLLALLILTACAQDPLVKQVDLRVSIATPMGKAAEKTAFAPRDTIDLYQWTPYGRGVQRGKFAYDGAEWINASDLLWHEVDTPHYFVSFFPQTTMNEGGTIAYDIATDSALLCARVLAPGRTAEQGSVPLAFRYVSSRLVVELNYGVAFAVMPRVVSLTVRSIGTKTTSLCLAEPTISANLSGFKDVALYPLEPNKVYTAHFVPQSIGELELVVEYNGKKRVFYQRIVLTLESGNIHRTVFTVN